MVEINPKFKKDLTEKTQYFHTEFNEKIYKI